jgi:hypothetical protein
MDMHVRKSYLHSAMPKVLITSLKDIQFPSEVLSGCTFCNAILVLAFRDWVLGVGDWLKSQVLGFRVSKYLGNMTYRR